MSTIRVALANLRYPPTPAESVRLAIEAVEEAAARGAMIVCFPECYVPGYRVPGRVQPPPDPAFLEHAWSTIALAAGRAGIAVVLGTERVVDGALRLTALVVGPDGERLGFQDKVQLDPSEEPIYTPGAGRQTFRVGDLTFGVVICHEGWRYPETVRWPAARGAQVVFHPHFHEATPGSYRPTTFADPANTFHEKAMLCRAAENTCWFVSVNCAGDGSPSTSAVARPDGSLQCWQPYGQEGLLLADLELAEASGLLASRYKPLI